MKKLIWTLALGVCQLSLSQAQTKPDTLSFLHMTDPHLIFNETSYNAGFINRRLAHFKLGHKPFVEFFKKLPKATNADFAVITGDMVDFYDAETETTGEMLGNQVEQFSQLLDQVADLPVYMILGNHDMTSYPKKGYHQFDAAHARAAWVRNAAVFKNGTHYRRDVQVGRTQYRLIFLDNSYFSKDFYMQKKGKADFAIDQSQLDWLEHQVEERSTDVEIIFMHMPFPESDETKKLKSLAAYSEHTNTAYLTNILEKENARVKLFIVGHNHKNKLSEFNFSKKVNFTQVMTGAFGYDSNNWRLIKLTEDKVLISQPGSSEEALQVPVQ